MTYGSTNNGAGTVSHQNPTFVSPAQGKRDLPDKKKPNFVPVEMISGIIAPIVFAGGSAALWKFGDSTITTVIGIGGVALGGLAAGVSTVAMIYVYCENRSNYYAYHRINPYPVHYDLPGPSERLYSGDEDSDLFGRTRGEDNDGEGGLRPTEASEV